MPEEILDATETASEAGAAEASAADAATESAEQQTEEVAEEGGAAPVEATEAATEAPAEEGQESETAEEGEAGKAERAAKGDEAQQAAQLAETYRQHPELKEVFKEHPQLRAPFFKALEMNKVFSTVQDAQFAREYAEEHLTMEQLYNGDANGKRELLKQMYEFSLDDSGQPTGHYEELASLIVSDTLTNLLNANQNDANGQAAIRWIRGKLGLSGRDTEPANESGAAAPDAREAALRRREAEIARREGEYTVQMDRTFASKLEENYDTWLGREIDARLAPAGAAISKLPTRFQTALRNDIARGVKEALRGDRFFSTRFESLLQSGQRSPEHAQKLLGELEQRSRQNLPGIVRDVLKEVGIQLMQSQKEKETRRAAGAARREPAATGSPAKLTGQRSGPQAKPGENFDSFANRVLGVE